ncbi:glycosyl transferase family protein [Arvimicrobium flavum]|uniref:glycosyl transferase family protein n=1 Tax=Arvimicrobium flavum TaxID=3393320 RepID=UPI00237BEFAA|nr:glycosyl transferase family protein [Mesorhizobium shangrilense]
MSRLRLLVALDALLVEQSVGRAAERMGLTAPAMSRLLKQIREIYGDPILRKTGRGMASTPFAERLRLRLRALAEEASDLLQPQELAEPSAGQASASNRLPLSSAPALSLAPVIDIGGPTSKEFAAKLAAIGPRALPQQRLARAIATMGAGAGRSRPLTMHEAREAFAHILAGRADPIQVGAFLSIMQFRHATAPELAGMATALREHIAAGPPPSGDVLLDWPAYLSPKAPLQPWFLMAVKLVNAAGTRVLVHGGRGLLNEGERLKTAAEFLGIPVAADVEDARSLVNRTGLAFLPVLRLSDQLTALMALYPLFEMRSPINQLVHLINPLNASGLMVGAVQSSHRNLIREAAELLCWRNVLVTSTNRDVAEATPLRSTTIFRVADGTSSEMTIPASTLPATERPTGLSSFEYWKAVWLGQARDEAPIRKVVDTAALALMNARKASATQWPRLQLEATKLWRNRLGMVAAP